MSETPFYRTRMGQLFYERTMPELVKQLQRLNDLLEQVAPKIKQEDTESENAR